MQLAIVVVYLFSSGLLGLFVSWRIDRNLRAASVAHQLNARRLSRANRRILSLARSVRELSRLVRAERIVADQTRAKFVDFIDGPVSQRTPQLPGPRGS
jgi:hypothetical protein